jgi:ribosomal protein S18 acetylase RimI-like enzyme
MNDVVIRSARPDDSRDFARLIVMSDKTFLPYLFGNDFEQVVQRLFRTRRSLYSHEHVRIVEVEGSVKGMLLAYTYDQMRAEMARSGSGFLRSAGLGFLFRLPAMLFRSVFHRRPAGPRPSWVNPGEYYLANMAVLPEYRRQGLGRMLLADAETRAKELGCTRLALDVEAENTAAVRLYERYGFIREEHNLRVMGKFEFLRFSKPVPTQARPD